MTRPRPLIAGIALVLAIGIGGYIAYDQVLSGDSVAPLALPSDEPQATVTSAPAAGASTPGSTAPEAGATDVSGTWSLAAGGQAGYRVRERLATLSAESDAVGRTSDVTGSITLAVDGATTTLTAGSITVDTTTIRSDEDRRDNRLRSEGLETDAYPTATFSVTQPVEIPANALAGTAAEVTLVGDLELHGVTKPVSIPAQARLVDETIEVVGSITFLLSDFEIVAPNVGGFIISIADEGTLEFAVTFTRG